MSGALLRGEEVDRLRALLSTRDAELGRLRGSGRAAVAGGRLGGLLLPRGDRDGVEELALDGVQVKGDGSEGGAGARGDGGRREDGEAHRVPWLPVGRGGGAPGGRGGYRLGDRHGAREHRERGGGEWWGGGEVGQLVMSVFGSMGVSVGASFSLGRNAGE